jgi:CDP-diacylglycerol---serine O-phosphatidyltransferase
MNRAFPPLRYLNAPNAMSSAAVAVSAACLSLLASGHVRLPAALYLAALGLDYLDGVVARRFGQATKLGGELDSLADLLNFCATPAIVGWMMGLRSGLEVVALTAFVVAGAWRLAYYNVHGLEDVGGKAVFRGLPTPYAAAYFVTAAALCRVSGLAFERIGAVFFALSAALMISGVPVPKRGPLLPLTALVTTGAVLAVVVHG